MSLATRPAHELAALIRKKCLVGRRHDDLGVLQASAAFEAALPWTEHDRRLDEMPA